MKFVSCSLAFLLCCTAGFVQAAPATQEEAPPSIEINFGALSKFEPEKPVNTTPAKPKKSSQAKLKKKPEVKTPAIATDKAPTVKAQDIPPVTPATNDPAVLPGLATMKEVPKLPEGDLSLNKQVPAPAPRTGVMGNISGGISELLIDDAAKPNTAPAANATDPKLLAVISGDKTAANIVATPGTPTPSATVQTTPAVAPESAAAEKPIPSGTKPALSISFNESATDVPLASTAALDTIATSLTADPALKATLEAYASGPESAGIYPKRVSLARGIAVRNYLTSTKGINIERIIVKAQGNKTEDGSAATDHVDVFLTK